MNLKTFCQSLVVNKAASRDGGAPPRQCLSNLEVLRKTNAWLETRLPSTTAVTFEEAQTEGFKHSQAIGFRKNLEVVDGGASLGKKKP